VTLISFEIALKCDPIFIIAGSEKLCNIRKIVTRLIDKKLRDLSNID